MNNRTDEPFWYKFIRMWELGVTDVSQQGAQVGSLKILSRKFFLMLTLRLLTVVYWL